MKAWFMAIDKDASGTIDFDEFFEHIDEKRTNFTEGLFRLAGTFYKNANNIS